MARWLVAAQLPAFTRNVEQLTANSPQLTAPIQNATVLGGIDVLERNKFTELAGKRIGLVTNHTGRNLAGKPTIDILHEAENVDLVRSLAVDHAATPGRIDLLGHRRHLEPTRRERPLLRLEPVLLARLGLS